MMVKWVSSISTRIRKAVLVDDIMYGKYQASAFALRKRALQTKMKNFYRIQRRKVVHGGWGKRAILLIYCPKTYSPLGTVRFAIIYVAVYNFIYLYVHIPVGYLAEKERMTFRLFSSAVYMRLINVFKLHRTILSIFSLCSYNGIVLFTFRLHSLGYFFFRASLSFFWWTRLNVRCRKIVYGTSSFRFVSVIFPLGVIKIAARLE